MSELTDFILSHKKIQLVEPTYTRKYPPLGLAKIATLVKKNGGEVYFSRGSSQYGDLICLSSLFTFDFQTVMTAISHAQLLNPGVPILLGGVCATLLHDKFASLGVRVFKGCDRELDACVPDYGIDWGVEDPWGDFSFTFTSRGCPNRCAYCAVKRLEPVSWINENWRDHIVAGKPNAMISDNNLSSQPEVHLAEVIDFLASKKKKVVFDNGFDCKFITREMAEQLARLKFTRTGMRVAFDRIEEDGQFQDAVVKLLSAGVPKSQIMAYVLFNFTDTPKEAYYRMSECRRLGIRPYPQQYEPLGETSRTVRYVGKHWTKGSLRAFRYYWLMAGVYGKHDFPQWITTYAKDQFSLTEEDIQAFAGIESKPDARL